MTKPKAVFPIFWCNATPKTRYLNPGKKLQILWPGSEFWYLKFPILQIVALYDIDLNWFPCSTNHIWSELGVKMPWLRITFASWPAFPWKRDQWNSMGFSSWLNNCKISYTRLCKVYSEVHLWDVIQNWEVQLSTFSFMLFISITISLTRNWQASTLLLRVWWLEVFYLHSSFWILKRFYNLLFNCNFCHCALILQSTSNYPGCELCITK